MSAVRPSPGWQRLRGEVRRLVDAIQASRRSVDPAEVARRAILAHPSLETDTYESALEQEVLAYLLEQRRR